MNDPFMFFFDWYDGGLMYGDSSHIPYELRVRAELLPEDEDHYPMGYIDWSDFEEWAESEYAEFHTYNKEHRKQVLDLFDQGMYYDFEEEELHMLLEQARSLQEAESLSGYFQMHGDVDVFTMTPEKNGLFEVEWNESKTLTPILEVYQVKEEDGVPYLRYLTESAGFNIFTGEMEYGNPKLYLGLEEGETYVILMANQAGYGKPSLDAYELSLSLLKENPQDRFWKNNDFHHAANLPDYAFEANLAMTGSQDVFYFTAEESGLAGFHFENRPIPSAITQGLPSDVFTSILPIILVVEDTNGDGELTGDENQKFTPFMPYNIDETELRGSFKVKEGSGYFIVVANESYFSGQDTLLTPYRLQVATIDHSRAEGQPVRQAGSGQWRTMGFLPVESYAGYTHTEHSFNAPKKGRYLIALDMPADIDGVLSIVNHKGETVKKVDSYGKGDSEAISLTLDRGTYKIVVQDTNGNSSLHPYYVTIKEQ
jgi:hypothetical protein